MPEHRQRGRALLAVIAMIVLLAFVIRSPVIAVAPVIDVVASAFGVTSAAAGLLTSVPVLCFALATPLAVYVVSRGGANLAVTVTLLGVLLGTVLRSVGSLEWAIAGTLLLGVAITIGNVVVPVVIRREVPTERVGTVTGIFVSSINLSTAAATLGTAPLQPLLGWQLAIAVWALPAIAGLALWVLHKRRDAVTAPASSHATVAPPRPAALGFLREAGTWLLTLMLAAQAFSYYAVTAWLPTILRDELLYTPTAAGASASVFQATGVLAGVLIPLIVARRGVLTAAVVVSVLWLAVPLGLLVAPELWLLWTMGGGIAHGGGFTMVFMLIVALARDDAHASALSGFVQGAAYLIAASGPAALGLIHDLTGAWQLPLLLLVGTTAVFAVMSVASALLARRTARERPQ